MTTQCTRMVQKIFQSKMEEEKTLSTYLRHPEPLFSHFFLKTSPIASKPSLALPTSSGANAKNPCGALGYSLTTASSTAICHVIAINTVFQNTASISLSRKKQPAARPHLHNLSNLHRMVISKDAGGLRRWCWGGGH